MIDHLSTPPRSRSLFLSQDLVDNLASPYTYIPSLELVFGTKLWQALCGREGRRYRPKLYTEGTGYG